jgi:hypothetical protein
MARGGATAAHGRIQLAVAVEIADCDRCRVAAYLLPPRIVLAWWGKAKEGAAHLLNDVSAYRCRILDGPRNSV